MLWRWFIKAIDDAEFSCVDRSDDVVFALAQDFGKGDVPPQQRINPPETDDNAPDKHPATKNPGNPG